MVSVGTAVIAQGPESGVGYADEVAVDSVEQTARSAGADQVVRARDGAHDVAGAGAGDEAGRIAGDDRVGQRGRAAEVRHAADAVEEVRVGVTRDGATGQRHRAPEEDQAAAIDRGGVAVDGAIGQHRRTPEDGEAAAIAGDGVADDRAVGQRGRAIRGDAATAAGDVGESGRVADDRAVGQVDGAPIVVQAPAIAGSLAVGDRQSRERRGDALVDLEHPAEPAAADRHARRRSRDGLGLARVAQLELRARQGDRLRRGEHIRIEADVRIPRAVGVGEGDGQGQCQQAGAGEGRAARRGHD